MSSAVKLSTSLKTNVTVPDGSVATERTLPLGRGDVRPLWAMAGHAYPTDAHARAADEILEFFADDRRTDAVLLTGSCARGKSSADSCLDVQVIARDAASLWEEWERHARESPPIAELANAGRFSELHLDVGDGSFEIGPVADEGRLGMLEVAVGNRLVYAVPLWSNGSRLDELGADWLPYYGEELRIERLAAVGDFARHDLDHVEPYLARGLHFQSLARLHRAFQAFLMGLHIARRTYPISYEKWIHEQVAENLGLPELYERLPAILEVSRLESDELAGNASELRALLDEYIGGD